ncbi:hypothetical protein BDV59DRAFT_197591 [Aspergillus ambiguus]|uniref:uncharacterized protein n=1 Tax=Aspergillus ambiguus TaxID=176160 RepID=UPI003CCE5323
MHRDNLSLDLILLWLPKFDCFDNYVDGMQLCHSLRGICYHVDYHHLQYSQSYSLGLDYDNFLMFLEEGVYEQPGKIEVVHRHTGMLSSARTGAFGTVPFPIYVAGLTGCTAVGIVSEAGAWLSHFWESPSFMGSQERFQSQVLDPIKNGDGVQMPSPFPLGQPGGYLNPENNAQIFIMTPGNGGEMLYGDKVMQIENLLTGTGAPWNGVQVTKHIYTKPGDSEEALKRYNYSPRGKFSIEYDNNQEFDIDEEDWDAKPRDKPMAIWRVYMEDERHYHEWTPKESQRCSAGNQRRDGSCARPITSITSSSQVPSQSLEQPPATSIGLTTSSTEGDRTSTSLIKPSTSSTMTTSPGITVSPQESPSATGLSSSALTTVTAYFQYDSGSGRGYCQVEGYDGSFQTKPSTTQNPSYKPCDWKTMPPPLVTTPVTAYTTYANGVIGKCTDGQWGNYAVNHVPTCPGSVSIISTNMPIASAWSSSTAAASAAAASSSSAAAAAASASAAAAMSGDCTIIYGDYIFGQSVDSIFYLSDLGDWADEDTLREQEDGCGSLSGWVWEDTGDGKHQAGFELGGFDAGCVERAVKSAGGPDLSCYNKPDKGEELTDEEVDMKNKVLDAEDPW